MRTFGTAMFALCSAVAVFGQTAGPVFDAASIRPSGDTGFRAIDGSLMSGAVLPGGIWRARDATVENLIRGLYPGHGLPGQVVGGPDWIRRDFYDIEARANRSATGDQIRQMARGLLVERFKLRVRTEMREMPAVLLRHRSNGRLGKGLSTPAVDCARFRAGGERPADPTRKPFGDRLGCATANLPVMPHTQIVDGTNMRITAGDVLLSELQVILSRHMGRAVVDRTGLTQRFDVELQFRQPPQTATELDDKAGPLLRTAIAEQLGLQVEDGRTSAKVLVIDHIERPTEN